MPVKLIMKLFNIFFPMKSDILITLRAAFRLDENCENKFIRLSAT